jgi:predicted amidohydrolase YtcJ
LTSILFRRVEVDGILSAVFVQDGVITSIARENLQVADVAREIGTKDPRDQSWRVSGANRAGEDGVDGDDDEVEEIDGAGGALIPGLHDQHLHLFAMAAAASSVDVSGDALAALWAADATLAPGEWIRAVGWQESSGWELDRKTLDYAVPGRPVRVQHASGALWVLNSPALEAVHLGSHETGRLFGMDALLRDRLGGTAPDLGDVSRALSEVGVTRVTDATPYERAEDLRSLPGAMAQQVTVMGAPDVDVSDLGPVLVGPAKIVVADHDPSSVEELVEQVQAARRHDRGVAFHCASRLGLVLALAALDEAGSRRGDRIEHGAVIPDDAMETLRRLGVTVVTQPGFVVARGDRYLADVEEEDQPFLWRCGSLLRAGIPVAGSSDAPHGPVDPWRAMQVAVDRRTATGQVLGNAERVSAAEALRLYVGDRRVEVGAAADVCLLRVPLAEALAHPDASVVRRTVPLRPG